MIEPVPPACKDEKENGSDWFVWLCSVSWYSVLDLIWRRDSLKELLLFFGGEITQIRDDLDGYSMARRGDYLFTDSRCVVAHVDHRPFVDPDKDKGTTIALRVMLAL